MGVRLARDAPAPPHPPPASPQISPDTGEMRMIAVCALHAQMLRRSAESASPLQSERAVVEWGAAAALERAAHLWADRQDQEARAWMRAAENSLAVALIPVPWART